MASAPDADPQAIWQVVVVDGTEFPSMDGVIANSSDPFVVLASTEATEEFLQTSTIFRVRARTGVAQWNEVFKVTVPESTVFLEVEVRDHDLHGSLRKGAAHTREKENTYRYDYLRRFEMDAEDVSLKDHMRKRMKDSQAIGRGEVLLKAGFQTVRIYNRSKKRVGRLGVNVTRLDAPSSTHTAGGEIRRQLSLPEAIHGDQAGPPIWAWLILLAFATYYPSSSFIFRAVSTSAMLGAVGVIAFRAWRCLVHSSGRGTIGFEEFRKLAPKMIPGVKKTSDKGLLHLFQTIDTDNSGAVEPDELAAFTMRVLQDAAAEAMNQSKMTKYLTSLRAKGSNFFTEHMEKASDLSSTTGKAAIGASSLVFLAATFWNFWLGGLISV